MITYDVHLTLIKCLEIRTDFELYIVIVASLYIQEDDDELSKYNNICVIKRPSEDIATVCSSN